jgi:transposase
MSYYVGLEVSVKLKAICIIDDAGKAVMERLVASDPDDIGRCIEGNRRERRTPIVCGL